MAASDRCHWENFGTQNGITDDGYDHHSLHGTPCFEVTEKNNDLLNGILKDILQRIREHDETLKPWKYLFRS